MIYLEINEWKHIMSQLKLNKSSLSIEQKNLKNYQKYLPSLELKRRKLLSVKSGTESAYHDIKKTEQELKNRVLYHLPMVSEHLNDFGSLLEIDEIDIQYENVVGTMLPNFRTIHFKVNEYSFFNTPHWIEPLIEILKQQIETELRLRVLEYRLRTLNQAIQTVTQRKNLFEKVLIPRSLTHIRMIQIFLSDNERAAVVRSKIAKKKRQQT